MTDFRRPDLDLWDEEEDAEDARPTIVAERPAASRPPQVPASSRANGARSSLMQRLIEKGELEEEQATQPAESLRDSEVDQLTVVELDSPLPHAVARASVPRPTATLEEVESEAATEDAVPTVSAKRPLPSANTPLPAPAAQLTLPPPPPRFADREVTERISIPSAAPLRGMAGSIAPATKTFRPDEQGRGMPFWQTAVAAVLLVGGGLSIAKLWNEKRSELSTASIQAPRSTELAPTPGPALPKPAEPTSAPGAATAVAEPVTGSPQPVRAEAPAPEAPAQDTVPSAVPEPPPPAAPPELPPTRTSPPEDTTTRRVRRVERVAYAGSAAEGRSAPEPATTIMRESAAPALTTPEPALAPPSDPASGQAAAAVPAPAPATAKPPQPSLPAQPSREDVAAALNAIVPELQKCVGDRHDTAEVTLTVRPGGFVSYAVVSGAYAGSSEGSCIARAVKAAKFPMFTDPSLRITYPFQL